MLILILTLILIINTSGSFVSFDECPTPKSIYDAFRFVKAPSAIGIGGPSSRDNFINAQWAFGGITDTYHYEQP